MGKGSTGIAAVAALAALVLLGARCEAGALEPDGTSTWWTARGSVPAADLTPGVTLTLTGPDGARELAAHHGLRPDSSTYNVFAPLPDDVARYTALELRAAGELLVSRSLEDVRVLHERSR